MATVPSSPTTPTASWPSSPTTWSSRGERGPEFEPGSRWAYGNFGFILLGAVIERNGWVGHGGAPGMNGDLRIYPRSGYVAVVLTNLDPPPPSASLTASTSGSRSADSSFHRRQWAACFRSDGPNSPRQDQRIRLGPDACRPRATSSGKDWPRSALTKS